MPITSFNFSNYVVLFLVIICLLITVIYTLKNIFKNTDKSSECVFSKKERQKYEDADSKVLKNVTITFNSEKAETNFDVYSMSTSVGNNIVKKEKFTISNVGNI